MENEFYEIRDESNNLIGSYLTRSNALLLIDALFAKYYADKKMKLTISRMIFETENYNE